GGILAHAGRRREQEEAEHCDSEPASHAPVCRYGGILTHRVSVVVSFTIRLELSAPSYRRRPGDRRGPQRGMGPVAPREDSRPLGARAARPLPARHSAGVIAFAALARVVADSGRAARAPGGTVLMRLGLRASARAASSVAKKADITNLNSEP